MLSLMIALMVPHQDRRSQLPRSQGQRAASTKKHGTKRANSTKANRVTQGVVMFAKVRHASKPGEDFLSMFHIQYQRRDGTCSPGWIQLDPAGSMEFLFREDVAKAMDVICRPAPILTS